MSHFDKLFIAKEPGLRKVRSPGGEITPEYCWQVSHVDFLHKLPRDTYCSSPLQTGAVEWIFVNLSVYNLTRGVIEVFKDDMIKPELSIPIDVIPLYGGFELPIPIELYSGRSLTVISPVTVTLTGLKKKDDTL